RPAHRGAAFARGVLDERDGRARRAVVDGRQDPPAPRTTPPRRRARRAAGDDVTAVGVTGASGLVGRALVPRLEERGYEVRALPRRPEHEHLAGLAAVVHLSGEPLYALRWTPAKKRRIEESRAEGTRHLAER